VTSIFYAYINFSVGLLNDFSSYAKQDGGKSNFGTITNKDFRVAL